MKRKALSRRTLLRGVGGVSVGLPFLEAMLAPQRASAQTAPPKRYVVVFGGHSLNKDGTEPTTAASDFIPNRVGTGYDLKAALAPLGDPKWGAAQSEISVVSGLRIPTATGGSVPAGGRPVAHHKSSGSPLLSGVRATSTSSAARGPTSDQVMAGILGKDTRFPSLVMRAQVAFYVVGYSSDSTSGRMSFRADSSGKVSAVTPTVSPRQAFSSLFGSFVPPDEAERQQQLLALESRRSVLDLVLAESARLKQSLGMADRVRLDLHLEEIRALEKRVQAIDTGNAPLCQKPPDPGADPSVGNDGGEGVSKVSDDTTAYSGEDERAAALVDLIHMAFVCDLSRVASLQLTFFQCFLNLRKVLGSGVTGSVHEMGHSASTKAMFTAAMGWHVGHFGRLVAKFRDTPEAGGKMIDNMALTYLCEGGFGLDPSSGEKDSTHSTENMAVLVAGRAGGLKPGQHLIAPSTANHPANVLVTAMKATGYASDTLGEVTGTVPGLTG